ALAYHERMERDVHKLAAGLTDPLLVECDVNDDAQIAEVYRRVGDTFGRLDAVIHSVAFAERDDLEGRFVDTTRRGFQLALEISAYSLVAVTRPALPLMTGGGCVITMTFA